MERKIINSLTIENNIVIDNDGSLLHHGGIEMNEKNEKDEQEKNENVENIVLEVMEQCSGCGRFIPIGDDFCPECVKEIEEVKGFIDTHFGGKIWEALETIKGKVELEITNRATDKQKFCDWLDRFVDEKGLDTSKPFKIVNNDKLYEIPLEVVLTFMKDRPSAERWNFRNTLIKIDFLNGDVMAFFRYICKGMVRFFYF